MNKHTPNQRLEPRILRETTIFVETYSSPSGETKAPNIVISKTLDLSANGVQVIMDHPIPMGSILQLGVDFGGQPPRFHLIGEVRWVKKTHSPQHFLVGFKLLDSDDCHIEDWKRQIASLLASTDNELDQA